MNGSLIEVLVGLTLLSLTLISGAMLSIYSLHTVQSAYYLTIADRQLTNMDNYLQDVHGIISQHDIDRWDKELAEQLPAGSGHLLGEYPHYRLIVNWGSSQKTNCEHAASGREGCQYIEW